MDTESATRDWYARYRVETGADRNDLLLNPEVLYQYLATEAAVISALRSARLERETARILDVGCGKGIGLGRFVRLGFPPDNLYGIDLLPELIDAARAAHPTAHFACDDASHMSFESATFDLVTESTMFVQVTDPGLADRIAQEMRRVTKPGGYLLLIDWRYGKPRNPHYLAVSPTRIRSLFPDCTVVTRSGAALVPPVGRRLSRYAPWAYFPIQRLFPFLVGLRVTLLSAPSGSTATPRLPGSDPPS